MKNKPKKKRLVKNNIDFFSKYVEPVCMGGHIWDGCKICQYNEKCKKQRLKKIMDVF